MNKDCITKQDIKDFFINIFKIIFCFGIILLTAYAIYDAGKMSGFREGKDNQKSCYEAFYNCERK